MKTFFARSEWLDMECLRPLSHIYGNWELTWDHENESYLEEEDSYAVEVNMLLRELQSIQPPARYHDNEDRLAEYVRDHMKWPIRKIGARWTGADYGSILENGGYSDWNQQDLVNAAAGRIRAAIDRDQNHYDEMEESHRRMLGAVITVILYHRTHRIQK